MVVFPSPMFSSEQKDLIFPTDNNLDGFALLCNEDGFDNYGFQFDEKKSLTLLENDVFWEHEEVLNLLFKEKESQFDFGSLYLDGGFVLDARKDAVGWILKVVGYFGFAALTGVLAVGYYDRFVSSVYFQKDKPWMSQLAAVACLSIAAKMEETQVPLLLDLQVEISNYVFEAKTIMRMELLVLSSLKWRTSIVTPILFFDHFVRRFGLWANHHTEFLKRCEHVLLFIIADTRIMCYLSSVIATATMLFVLNEIDPDEVMDYRNNLLDVLGVDKEKVNDVYQLIIEVMSSHCEYETRKRKQMSVPGSPSGVIDAYLCCESSNHSSSAASSVSSSPEPFFKRSKAQDQPMRSLPLNGFSSLVADLAEPSSP